MERAGTDRDLVVLAATIAMPIALSPGGRVAPGPFVPAGTESNPTRPVGPTPVRHHP